MKRHAAFPIALMTLILSACNTPLGSPDHDAPNDITISSTGDVQQTDPTQENQNNESDTELNTTAHKIPVNVQESILVREGKKTIITDYYHVGTANFDAITIMADEENAWTSIDALVDMTSLEHTDGQSEQVMDHLRSDDFFGVDTYPTSHLVSTDITQTDSGYLVTADLTIKDETHPIEFILTNEDENMYTTSFDIDRTKRNITYGSDNFFDNLGDNVIGDMIHYDVTIVTD